MLSPLSVINPREFNTSILSISIESYWQTQSIEVPKQDRGSINSLINYQRPRKKFTILTMYF